MGSLKFWIVAILSINFLFATKKVKQEVNIFTPATSTEEEGNYEAKLNTSFTVKLEGNVTTGFGWFLANISKLDQSILQPTNLKKDDNYRGVYTSEQSSQRLYGAPGYFSFTFLPKGVTESPIELKFEYKRPWEDKDPAREYVLHVEIKN